MLKLFGREFCKLNPKFIHVIFPPRRVKEKALHFLQLETLTALPGALCLSFPLHPQASSPVVGPAKQAARQAGRRVP